MEDLKLQKKKICTFLWIHWVRHEFKVLSKMCCIGDTNLSLVNEGDNIIIKYVLLNVWICYVRRICESESVSMSAL